MSTTVPNTFAFKPFQLETARALARCAAPCITATIPPFVPGGPGLHTHTAPAALLRSEIRQAEIKLEESKASRKQIAELLEPLHALAAGPEAGRGCPLSRVVFRSPDVFEAFQIRHALAGNVTVGGRFDFLAVLPELDLPEEFYILQLSKKHAQLTRAALHLEPVALPKFPHNIDDFLELNQPDHDRENRAAVGGASGPTRRVRFGTGSEREVEPAHLTDYYKAVDAATAGFLRGQKRWLVLEGVDEDTGRYRSVNTYPDMAGATVRGSPDDGITDDELLRHAYAILRAASLERIAAALAESQERLSPGRFSSNLDVIVEAAEAGRIASLYVAEDESDPRLNDAAIETIAHGGEAHAVPRERLSGGSIAAAAMRF